MSTPRFPKIVPDAAPAANDALRAALQRPIAFHPIFADVAGDVCSGLFLAQLWYWWRDHGGPVWKTIPEWTAETRLGRDQIQRARAKLRRLGIISEGRRTPHDATTTYTVHEDRLLELIAGNPQKPCIAGNPLHEELETSSTKVWKPAPPKTETTSETTLKIPPIYPPEEEPEAPPTFELVEPASNSAAKNPPKPPARKTARTPLPEDWQVSVKGRAFAAERGISAHQLVGQVEKFRANHESRGSLMANWDAAWRTWTMNYEAFAVSRPPAWSAPVRAYRDSTAMMEELTRIG